MNQIYKKNAKKIELMGRWTSQAKGSLISDSVGNGVKNVPEVRGPNPQDHGSVIYHLGDLQ